MSIEEKVISHIDSQREVIISFMQKLIRTQSITGDESKIGALMAEECRRDGLEVDIVEPAENRVSVVAKYHGVGGGPRVMIYSHYDTLPEGDPNSWIHPAFSGEISEGYIWGRGSCDNKLATCGITMAFRALKELGVKLKGDIVFTHVADEEKSSRFGFREILDRGYGEDIDYLFYAHGGSGDTIGVASNGDWGLSLRVKGKSAHTARLEDGINAVVKASHLILHLENLAKEVNKREYKLPGTDSVMRSRFSINKCVGYVATNNVPDLCEIYIDRRYTPNETPEQIAKEYCRAIDTARMEDPELDLDYQEVPGMLVSTAPADSELVRSIQKAAERVTGVKPKPVGGSHGSDHSWFVAKYAKPFASYGIGGEGIHSSNERVRVEDVISTTKVYALSMIYILGT